MKKINILIFAAFFIPHFLTALTYECSREHKIKTGIFSTQTVAFNKCSEHEIACMCSSKSPQGMKDKFKKIWEQHQLRGTPQHQALKADAKNGDEEAQKKAEEIRDSAVKIHNYLAYCSSAKKIESFLAATNASINEDIFKNNEIRWGIKKILDILTHSVIGEQCAYINLPVNLAIIKFCLEKGAIPNTQFVLAQRDEFEKKIQKIKDPNSDHNNKPGLMRKGDQMRDLREFTRMRDAANKILELYKKYPQK